MADRPTRMRPALAAALAAVLVVAGCMLTRGVKTDTGERVEASARTGGEFEPRLRVSDMKRQAHAAGALRKAESTLDMLAVHLLKHGAAMTEAKMVRLLQNWRNAPDTISGTLHQTALATLQQHRLGHASASSITSMLAPAEDKHLSEMLDSQMLPGGDSGLCAKQQKIIDKFDALLKKLGGEELSLKIELGEVTEEWKKSMESYLNAESQYRLRLEQAKEAADGAKFAEEEYEKWRTAHKAASRALADATAQMSSELEGLKNEEKMIRKIMRYIGVLHDVKASDRSKAAGGRDSVKGKKGVSNPYESDQHKATDTAQLSIDRTKVELEDTVNQLASLMAKSKIPGADRKVAQLAQKASMNKLAVYDESVEVVKILKELLDDIVTRKEVLLKQDDTQKKLVDDAKNKMVEWETKLVALGNARDKSAAKAAAGSDLKDKLNGEKVRHLKDVCNGSTNELNDDKEVALF